MVTISADDLIQPYGILDPAYFPDDNGPSYIDGWLFVARAIVEANTAVVAEDAAAAAYVYGRAFDFLATRYNTLATTTTIGDEITRTINDAQIKFYQSQAAKWADRYAAYAQGQTEAEIIAAAVAPRFLFTVS